MSNDVTKLPKWAQELISDLTFRRDQATQKLQNFLDTQTPSKVYVEELTHVGSEKAPRFLKRYIVDTNEVTFDITRTGKNARSETVTVRISRDDPAELIISANWNSVAIHPSASNVIRLKTSR